MVGADQRAVILLGELEIGPVKGRPFSDWWRRKARLCHESSERGDGIRSLWLKPCGPKIAHGEGPIL